ncbi:transglycosylase domain-containing protein [Lacibacter sediminis]|uniref:Transglycosylase domain-containing protein n=1 Tax=Lacibacter sediminis TaxID=2760713 RepID=A0A7G5XDR8_9BACT|nr:transglycosylase domain-containing protein [Lacibacter sediminis]QNA43621.1 transglycosylase domain-containing protein [Lacibacter sediminis]
MRKPIKYLWRAFFIGMGLFILLVIGANFGLLGKMPSLEELENPSASLASEVIASDGTMMGKFYLEDRTNVEYKDISKNIVNALIAAEDERFYEHSGIDGRALARAIAKLGSDGGGSTITQQLALNLFRERAKNKFRRVFQKIQEWIIAVKLERNFTKDEIVALYLNTVEYSDNVFGIRNASKTFFQKEPSLVTVDEAALLIGMVNAPYAYNPRLFPPRAMQKRNAVINDMVRNNFVSAPEGEKLKSKPINLKYKKLDESAGLAPYFRDVLRDQMKKWAKENKKPNGESYNIYRDGLKIYTTINPRMQLYAEEAVSKHMSALQKNYWTLPWVKDNSIWKGHENILERGMKDSDRWKKMEAAGIDEAEIRKVFKTKTKMKVFAWNAKRETDTIMSPYDSVRYHKMIIQTGFMVMDPFTGEVKAWVGGVNFKNFKFDHVNMNTKRQVGSTFKPILYAYAVENGYTPETPLPSGPINLGGKMITGGGGPMAICLAFSKNPGAAYLMNQFGVKSVINFAQSTGIKSEMPPYPSIALGSADISVYEMLQSYTMFPTNGMSTQPIFITRIEDRNGNILQTYAPEQKVVMSEAAAYTMVKMMQGVVDIGTGRRLRGMGLTGEIAGKTGTTNGNTDTWFIGFNPQLLAGGWVGCDDPFLKMVGEGNRTALPIWGYFFEKVFNDKTLAISNQAKFVQPESMKMETFMDYENFADRYSNEPDAENPDAGNGTSSDYNDLQLTPDPTLGPESQISEEQKVLQEAKKQADKNPEQKKDQTKPTATDPKKDSTKKKWWPFRKKNN